MELDGDYIVWVKLACLLNHGEFTTIPSFSGESELAYLFPPNDLDPIYTKEFKFLIMGICGPLCAKSSTI